MMSPFKNKNGNASPFNHGHRPREGNPPELTKVLPLSQLALNLGELFPGGQPCFYERLVIREHPLSSSLAYPHQGLADPPKTKDVGKHHVSHQLLCPVESFRRGEVDKAVAEERQAVRVWERAVLAPPSLDNL